MTDLAYCEKMVRAKWIVTQDANRTIIEDGGVAVHNGHILAVGPWQQLMTDLAVVRTIDLGDSILMPGLINTHTHASMTLFRGLGDDMPLMDWLTQRIWPIEKQLSPELVELGAMLACAEMARTGTTCFQDMYIFEEQIANAVRTFGMRGVLSEGILDALTLAYSSLDEAIEVNDRLLSTYQEDPLIDFSVAVHAVYTSTPDTMLRSFELAEQYNVPWSIHLAESASETAQVLEKFGKRPVACLEELGLLSHRTLLAHCVDLNQDEIQLLAERGVSVAHNPQSNMKLGSGCAPVQALLDAGVNVCLGTDGPASNNDLNMFTEMSTAALLAKVRQPDPTHLDAQTVLDMATRNGARAVGHHELGIIAQGKPADMIALDCTRPNMLPLYNPASHAVYAANGGDVRMTMVEGRVLYQDGHYKTIDYPNLLKEISKVQTWVLNAAKG